MEGPAVTKVGGGKYLDISPSLAWFLTEVLVGYTEFTARIPEPDEHGARIILDVCPVHMRDELQELMEKHGGSDLVFSW